MSNIKPNIILLGAGGHCLSVIDVIEQEEKYNILGILDNNNKLGNKILHYEVIGKDEDIDSFIDNKNYFLITVGQIKSPNIRVKLAKFLEMKKAKLATVISPLSYVSKHSKIEEGSIIMHNVTINALAKIGRNCIINTSANIEHGAIIRDFCHISTGAMINGDSVIGEKSFVGSNATISHGVTIESHSVIGAGKFIK